MSTAESFLGLPPQRKPIIFSLSSHSPHISVYEASMIYPSTKTRKQIISTWLSLIERYPGSYFTPHSQWNHLLLAEKIAGDLNREDGAVIEYSIPDERVISAPEFNFITQLNKAQLKLPESFFLDSKPEEHDTALSQEGLSKLMSYYARATGIEGHVAMSQEEFIGQLPEIIARSQSAPVACLVLLEPSKRHVTGFYFVKEGTRTTAYLFDTTGLTLPGYPCGYRGYPRTELKLATVLTALREHRVKPAILPTNTALTMQKDPYSCLMATLLFFNGMRKGEYYKVDDIGLCQVYGKPALEQDAEPIFRINEYSFPVQLYTIEHLPLLVGCQTIFALLFIMDQHRDADNIFPELIKYRADWQRKINPPYESFGNTFWQACYLNLLQWFELCEQNDNALPLPDFDQIMREGNTTRSERNALETFVEINKDAIVSSTRVRVVTTDPPPSPPCPIEITATSLDGEKPTTDPTPPPPSLMEETLVQATVGAQEATFFTKLTDPTPPPPSLIEETLVQATIGTQEATFFTKLYEIEQLAIKLRLSGEIDLANKAHQLCKTIFVNAQMYFRQAISKERFQQQCTASIQSTHRELKNHYLGRQIIGNICLALIGLGVFYLAASFLHKKRCGHFLFFQNDVVAQFDEIKPALLACI